MRMPTHSPTLCGSRSRDYANASENPGSSPPCRVPGTGSMTGDRVDRPRGLSVRLKLTLSYAGFLMLAGVLLLAAVWLFILRYLPAGVIYQLHPSWFLRT